MDPILEDVIVTTANEQGEIISRHIVSKANTLWRQYRLGGTYKDEKEEKVSIRERKVVKNRIIAVEEEKDVAIMNLDIYGSVPMMNGIGLNMKETEWGPGFIIGTKLPWIFRFDQSLYYLLFEYMSVSLPGGYYPLDLNGFNACTTRKPKTFFIREFENALLTNRNSAPPIIANEFTLLT